MERAEAMEMQKAVMAAAEDLTALIRHMDKLAQAAHVIARQPVEEQWATTWGELMKKVDAAKALGCSVGHVNRLIRDGVLQTAPNGMVVTRAAARWANSTPLPEKRYTGMKFRK